jgi:hypothetical protein
VPDTPAAAVPLSLNVQAFRRLATFADEIVDPAATLVLDKLPLGCVQDPAGVAALVFRVVAPGDPLLLHAATVKPTAAISPTHTVFPVLIAHSCQARRILIKLISLC